MKLRGGLFYDKRALKLLSWVIYLILIITMFVILLGFVQVNLSGDAVKEQVLAKQIGLAVDAAKPDTQIIINKGKFIVSFNKEEVTVKSKEARQGYTYNFFTQNKIKTEDKGGVLIINIS